MTFLFKHLLSSVYVALRGKSRTKSTLTDNTFNYHFSTLSADGKEERYIDLICHQFKHEVIFDTWYMPNRIYYTYKVDVVSLKDVSTVSHFPHMDFPHMCAESLHDTHYPHLCAINAYLDNSSLLWSKDGQ